MNYKELVTLWLNNTIDEGVSHCGKYVIKKNTLYVKKVVLNSIARIYNDNLHIELDNLNNKECLKLLKIVNDTTLYLDKFLFVWHLFKEKSSRCEYDLNYYDMCNVLTQISKEKFYYGLKDIGINIHSVMYRYLKTYECIDALNVVIDEEVKNDKGLLGDKTIWYGFWSAYSKQVPRIEDENIRSSIIGMSNLVRKWKIDKILYDD